MHSTKGSYKCCHAFKVQVCRFIQESEEDMYTALGLFGGLFTIGPRDWDSFGAAILSQGNQHHRVNIGKSKSHN